MTQDATHEHHQLETLELMDNRSLPIQVLRFRQHLVELEEFNIPFTPTERKRLNEYYHAYC